LNLNEDLILNKTNYTYAWIWPLVFILAATTAKAELQNKTDPAETNRISIVKTGSPITIDGLLDEEAWSTAGRFGNFVEYWPDDGGIPGGNTEIRMLYDDDHLYIALISEGMNGSPIIQSLRRNIEDDFWRSDGVAVVLDPFNERTHGYLFGVNAGNAQIDGTLSVTDNTTILDTNWDTRWYSATSIEDDRFIVEIAIPFSSLQYRENSSRWGLNIVRVDMERFEFSNWVHVPIPLPGYDLRYTGEIVWSNPPGNQGSNMVVLPYVAGDAFKDFETGGSLSPEFRIGGDIRYPLNSSMNLDIALNPDFSNVDVDEHIINLTRFDITLPEKRPFFLENGDIFTGFGRDEHRPFITRSIGLHNGQQIPVLYGAKFSGSFSQDLRVGAMNVQTQSHDLSDAQNYSAVAFQQRILNRSQLRGLFVNRQGNHLFSGESDYNRLGGLEFTYTSSGGRLSSRTMYHIALTPKNLNKNDFYGTDFSYISRHWDIAFQVTKINRNYITDTGFIPRQMQFDAASDSTFRRGFTKGTAWIAYKIIPENPRAIVFHEPGIYFDHQYDESGRLTDRLTHVWYLFETLRGRRFHTYLDYFEVQLPFETRLLGGQYDPLPPQFYSWYQIGFRYSGDTRRNFYGNYEVEAGTFYNGTRFSVQSEIVYRFSSRVRFGTVYTVNRVNFPDNYGEATLHLLGPRAHISFSNTLFWTTFIQYNTQAENLNINSRFQWRFRPMSDLFIVYNENSHTDNFSPVNRGLTFKLTYWFGL
jgi:hypothetical protein